MHYRVKQRGGYVRGEETNVGRSSSALNDAPRYHVNHGFTFWAKVATVTYPRYACDALASYTVNYGNAWPMTGCVSGHLGGTWLGVEGYSRQSRIDLGSIWDRSGVDLGSIRDRSGIHLGSI